MLTSNLFVLVSLLIGIGSTWIVWGKIIEPLLIYYGVKEISRNPKWITSKLNAYYGFHDIDIILCESKSIVLPRAYITKQKKIEIWINDSSVTTKDVEIIGRLALAVKLKIKYDLWFPEKSICWLSLLCYMLDGGNLEITSESEKIMAIKQEMS